MRRLMSVALIGLAVVGTSTIAAGQSNGQGQAPRVGRGRFGAGTGQVGFDTTRARQRDSVRAHGGADTVWAGRRAPRPGMAGRAALAGLKLTQAQKTSLKEIHKKYADQLKQLRQQDGEKSGAQNADGRAQFQSIMQREQNDIRAVLTPDQQKQFDANVARMRDRKGKGGKVRTKQIR